MSENYNEFSNEMDLQQEIQVESPEIKDEQPQREAAAPEIQYNRGYYMPPNPERPVNDENERKALYERAMKKSIKKFASFAGLSCVLIFAANILVTLIFLVIALPAMLAGDVSFLESPMVTMLLQIFGSFMMFVPPFVLLSFLAKKKLSQIVPMVKSKEKGWYLPSLLAGFGFCMLANILSNIFNMVLGGFGISSSAPDFKFPDGAVGLIISVIAVSVIPALLEEFAFRGVVLGILRPYGDSYAIIVSAVLFGLMHGNLEQIPFATMVGLVLGVIVCATDSIYPAMLVHFLNNFISIMLQFLTENSPEPIQAAANVGILALGMVSLVYGLILFFVVRRKNITLKPDQTGFTLGQKLKFSAATGGMIGAAIVTVIMMAMNRLSL